jgi:CheY-like chemotaxis protein
MDNSSYPICIIEDNKPIRRLFVTLLKKSGFETVDFPTGKSGIEWIKSNKPKCIIIDILLPDINGTEVLKVIRDSPGGMKFPIIAVTGFAHAYDRDKFIDLGFDSYIPKPVNTITFVEEVSKIIELKSDN